MSPDAIAEQALIDISRTQRRAWEYVLLLTAGISQSEAERIASLAAHDRAEVAAMERELAAA